MQYALDSYFEARVQIFSGDDDSRRVDFRPSRADKDLEMRDSFMISMVTKNHWERTALEINFINEKLQEERGFCDKDRSM